MHFLLLISSFNSVNGLPFLITCKISSFDIVWACPAISFCHYFYFLHPPYSLLHLQTNISLSWCLFYMFLWLAIKIKHWILCTYRSYFHQSELVRYFIAIMSTPCYWLLELPLIIILFQTCQLSLFYKKNQDTWQFLLSNKQSLKINGCNVELGLWFC